MQTKIKGTIVFGLGTNQEGKKRTENIVLDASIGE